MPDSSQTLDLGAFKHVVVPIGVVIALGVARIVTSLSHYIQNQERIRFSWTHAVWAVLLFLWFVGLWWIVWGLRHMEATRWSYFTLIYLLIGPALMYLATTLLLPDVPDGGQLDLGETFERVGRAFFLCLAGFVLWLACAEMFLLRESFLAPKRANQGVWLTLFLIGAAFPSRKTAAIIASISLPLALLALATIRAKLA